MASKLPFPLNYFATLFSPRRAFASRHELNCWQQLIVFLFLTALLLIPVPFYYARQNTVSLNALMPKLTKSLQAPKTAQLLADPETRTGHLAVADADSHHYIAAGRRQALPNRVQTGVLFTPQAIYLKFKGQTQPLQYVRANQRQPLATVEHAWFAANRGYYISSVVLLLGLILAAADLIVAFGVAGCLWLGRKSQLTDIRTFKEGLNLTLSLLGGANMLALAVGLIHFDIIMMLTVSSLGVVLLLLLVYVRTHFKDDETEKLAEAS